MGRKKKETTVEKKPRKTKTLQGSSTSKRYVCTCGFELVIHSDMDIRIPRACPMCKNTEFVKEEISDTNNVEEYISQQEQSA